MKKRILALVVCLLFAVSFLTACTADDSERLNFSAELHMTETHEVTRSYQGAAAYGKYFFQFSDHMENVGVYDLETKSLLSVAKFEMNELYHCNNANFGKYYWQEGDEFPLLYVSMENIDAHCALVLRVERAGNDFTFTKVQTVVYPDPKESSVYYPNCVIDVDNGYMYVMGYKTYSYKKAEGNDIRVWRFALPEANENTETVVLKVEDAQKTFELESITATQGAVATGGKIYQVYGYNNWLYFRVIDPEQGAFTANVRLIKHKFRNEPESLTYYNGAFYCGDVKGNIFRFTLDQE